MYRVMLVDDEPFILEGLKHVIDWAEYGLEITAEASDGLEALELLESKKINILLTDIKMPDMNGIDLIKAIREKGLNTKCIVLSGYDDFEYVKEAARLGIENYLLKPVNEEELAATLQSTVEKIEKELYQKIDIKNASDILRENILYRWVSGNISNAELTEKSSILGMDIRNGNFTVSIIKLFKFCESIEIQDSSREDTESLEYKRLMIFSAINICNEVIQQNCYRTAFTDLNGDILILFTNMTENAYGEVLSNTLKTCINCINKNLKLNVFATLGSLEPDYQHVYKSYARAKNLMNYSLVLSPNTFIDYYSASMNTQEVQKNIEMDFDILKSFITSQNRTDTFNFIKDLYSRLNTVKGLKPAFLQNITAELFYAVSSPIKSHKLDIYSMFNISGNLYDQISSISKMDDLCDWVMHIADRVIDTLQSKTDHLNPFINRVLAYVDTYYAQDISLKSLASTFNANAAYLGQLFKNETGEMFSVYLHKFRVKKAKELFANTRLNANDIAQKVGYKNANYFYSIFKKITGEYPTQYKKNL